MLLARFLSLAASFALVIAIPQYDSPEDIPLCAYNPIQSVINGVGCQVTETTCFCAKPDIVPSFASAVVAACNGEVNSAEVSSFASSFCVITGSATSIATTSSRRGPTPTPAGVTITSDESSASSTIPITTSKTSTSHASGTRASSSGASAAATTPTATATSLNESAGSPNLRVGALALALAVGGMTWIFSEL